MKSLLSSDCSVKGVFEAGHIKEVAGVRSDNRNTDGYLPMPRKEGNNQAALFRTILVLIRALGSGMAYSIDSPKHIPICTASLKGCGDLGIFKLESHSLILLLDIVAFYFAVDLL